jgi:arylsulfatase A-like enzyme
MGGRIGGTKFCLPFVGLLIVLSLGACSKGQDGAEVTADARHVVFISMDTARADHFGFMGSRDAKTPRIDALAKESVVFTNCMTAAPTTLASHTSLFTGKYPHHHGTPRNGYMVNLDNEMLPEILKRAGFHTAGFVGSFALGSRFDFAQGFDHFDETFDILRGQGEIDQNQRLAADVTDAVTVYLDKTGIPEHLFLFVHYFDPHRPYAAPEPFDRTFDGRGREDLESVMAIRRSKKLTETQRELHARRQEKQYASEIAYMDHHIGRLLDDLRDRGVLDNALLVLTSDHGENLWDHHMRFDHGNTVFQSTVHTVCSFRLPGGEKGGARVDGLIGNVDVLPTVLDFLGLAAPANIDGQAIDLRTAGEALTERIRFSQATKPHGELEENTKWVNMRKTRCVRKGRYKYIQNPHEGSHDLFDVVADPGEEHNLLSDPTPQITALVAELRKELEAWAASADPLPSQFEHLKREETTKRLRSLGYVE